MYQANQKYHPPLSENKNKVVKTKDRKVCVMRNDIFLFLPLSAVFAQKSAPHT